MLSGITTTAFALALLVQATPPAAGGSSSNVCSLATGAEFQAASEPDPRFKIPPGEPVLTEMVWGPHCDFDDGSIDLFTKKSPPAELDRVLELTKGGRTRTPVEGLGKKAFFTTVYPDDKYRRRGLIAVFLGSRILTLTLDPNNDEPLEATRPRLERLAKLVVPRVGGG